MTSDSSSAGPAGSPIGDIDTVRRLVDAWVADQAGTLAAGESAALDVERPGWRAAAAQLIAEGLLAYVAVEMVAPDLAIAAATNTPDHSDDAELTARLGAHVRDFVDYRDELDRLRDDLGLRHEGACDHPGHSH